MDQKHYRPNNLLCFSHLRWDFVFQRPQHLMSRFARQRRVFFVEEPVFEAESTIALQSRICPHTGVEVITPHLPHALQTQDGLRSAPAARRGVERSINSAELAAPGESVSREFLPRQTPAAENARAPQHAMIAELLRDHFAGRAAQHAIAWFYTPMALDYFPTSLSPSLIVYDCMDELSLFKNAPPRLQANEQRLLRMADLVFTGGVSLFEHKRAHHRHVYAFPSGVDVEHFAHARAGKADHHEHANIARPRLGYAGVIDERLDLELIDGIAQRRPEWQLVMIGPVAKIDPAMLPRRANIHWLGMKHYRDLPAYFAGWDVAMMPFALNDATRFISPTKTPEYLSAGLPVVSTPIRDVVRPYGELGLARIAAGAEEFVAAADHAMQQGMSLKWRQRADAFLQTLSWDSVWREMNGLIHSRLRPGAPPHEPASPSGEIARV